MPFLFEEGGVEGGFSDESGLLKFSLFESMRRCFTASSLSTCRLKGISCCFISYTESTELKGAVRTCEGKAIRRSVVELPLDISPTMRAIVPRVSAYFVRLALGFQPVTKA